MKVIIIIDKFINEVEFRNYSSYWLSKLGFTNIKIDPIIYVFLPKYTSIILFE